MQEGRETELDEGEQGDCGNAGGQREGAGQRSSFVSWAVAERCVAAGDTDGVQLPGAELLISR